MRRPNVIPWCVELGRDLEDYQKGRTYEDVRAIPADAGAALSIGCANPSGEFDNFAERYEMIDRTSSSSIMANCTPPAVAEADGDYFMTLSLSIDRSRPVVFLATLATAESGRDLSMSLSLQPLSKSDRVTPAGEPFVLDANVDPQGAFTTQATTITLAEEANPFNLPGDTVASGVTISGALCAPADFVCGGAYAELPVQGIKVPNSTFTMQRVDGVADYPEPPPINCAGDPAKTLEELAN